MSLCGINIHQYDSCNITSTHRELFFLKSLHWCNIKLFDFSGMYQYGVIIPAPWEPTMPHFNIFGNLFSIHPLSPLQSVLPWLVNCSCWFDKDAYLWGSKYNLASHSVYFEENVLYLYGSCSIQQVTLFTLKKIWGDLLRSVPLSWCDILNLTFCRLDFHQLLIKIS